MNIASDGGDEASPAGETGETARTVTIALITKVGVVGAGLRLNGAAFRLNPLRCSLELFEGMRAHWRPLAVFTRIFAAMFKICPFILGEQSDNAARKRIRGIEGLRAIAAKVGLPLLAQCSVHLTATRLTNYRREVVGHFQCFFLRQPLNFDFEILREKLGDENALVHSAALAEWRALVT
jgi:hypothetical protein